jgi:ABC-type Fe3+/spermidine/putrescine transport system ATPase subunit
MAEIVLDNVAHSYDGGETFALKKIDMTWEDGKAYALLGPSGCGKTTLLNIMSGIIKPSQGRIYMDGVDITDLSTTIYNQIGITGDKELMSPGGRPIEIVDGGQVLDALLAKKA